MSRATPSPDHAIFPTPENKAFQLSNPYRKLDTNRKEIRLLRFITEDDEGQLSFEMLQNLPLSDVRGSYTAISYCAGSAADTEVIRVNGVECNVFARLHHALQQTLEVTPRREIWCDQVCMNQYDLEERAQQVLLMRDIFNFAALVAVCLSDASSPDAGASLLWAAEISSSLRAGAGPVSTVAEYTDPEKSSSPIDLDFGVEDLTNAVSSQRDPRVTAHLRDHLLSESFLRGWEGFLDILASPWSQRAWACQEFAVSSNACFIHTGVCIPSECIRLVVQSLHTSTIDLLGTSIDDLPVRLLRHHYSLPELESNESLQTRVMKLLPLLEKIQRKVFTMSVFYGFAGLLGVYSLKDSWRKSSSLTNVLLKSSWYKASDNRDTIYAFQGLADPKYTTVPDYSPENTMEKLLTDFTIRIITCEDSLDVLSRGSLLKLDSRGLILPSWVVDWSVLRLRSRPQPGLGFVEDKEWASAGVVLVNMEEVKGVRIPLALCVAGMYVDTVENIQDEAVLTRQGFPLRNPRSSLKDAIGTRVWHAIGDEIWLLKGSDHLWVLRPETHPEGVFYRIVTLARFSGNEPLRMPWSGKLVKIVVI